MNEIQLSERLLTVASFIPKNSILADIGSDHAYLPSYAYLNGLCLKAIAGEVNEGPYQAACAQVKKLQLEDFIDVRKGNGLAVLHHHEATCVTIAGMGGTLIRTILDEGKEKLKSVKRLILQPNIHAVEIRKWLYENKWELINEVILEEDGKIYEVLVAEKGDPAKPYSGLRIETAMLMGPYLLKERNNVFVKKWTHELRHWENVYDQLEHAKETEQLKKKKEEVQSIIANIKEGI